MFDNPSFPMFSSQIKTMDITQRSFNNLVNFYQKLEDPCNKDIEYAMAVEELSIERDYFKSELFWVKEGASERDEELLRMIDCDKREKGCLEEEIYDGINEKETILKDIEVLRQSNVELENNLRRGLGIIGSIKESLIRVHVGLYEHWEHGFDEGLNFEGELEEFFGGLDFVLKMMKRVEDKLDEFQKKVLKETKELENSVLSLTEENRDVNALLRIALIEKEAVEKSLNKLKGYEQKRVPLLQFAERGLQRVGFGFILGGGYANTEQNEEEKKDNEKVSENMASNASITSDVSSECEEEVSLASTVEKMMKNLRLEITQLRKALEESRSDAERLQCLTEKQAEQIAEQTVYIKDLKYKVEELLIKIKATEEDVERWTEACELEVEAGKHAVEERDELIKTMDITQRSFNNLVNLYQKLEDPHNMDVEYAMAVEELSIERDYFKSELFWVKEGASEREEELLRMIDCEKREKGCLEEEIYGGINEKETILKEIEVLRQSNEELENNLIRGLGIIGSIKESLIRVHVGLYEHRESGFDEGLNFEGELEEFFGGLDFVLKMMKRVEEKLDEFQKKAVKEKKELENSMLSLTEENRDVNALLRIALIEKEAVEKSLNKLKGYEQKRVPLLQFAERGLQRVGFGFILGGGYTNTEQNEEEKKDNVQVSENMASNASITSDVSSECEEEVVSLASTVEKMMKNLRLEITQLRKALEESRSDAERLQCLTEKQAEQIAEQTVYIKDLKYKVEELLIKIKATEEDVERWTEACELEVEAGKHAVEERDELVDILKRELEKTRAGLAVSDSKLKLKEELANAAMAAQSASERSLHLADNRASILNQRIEELTRQLEEAEDREKRNKRKHRRICWPWRALKVVNPVKRVLPEMQPLLHHRD